MSNKITYGAMKKNIVISLNTHYLLRKLEHCYNQAASSINKQTGAIDNNVPNTVHDNSVVDYYVGELIRGQRVLDNYLKNNQDAISYPELKRYRRLTDYIETMMDCPAVMAR